MSGGLKGAGVPQMVTRKMGGGLKVLFLLGDGIMEWVLNTMNYKH